MCGDENQLQATHKERNGQHAIAFVTQCFNNGFFGRLRDADHCIRLDAVSTRADECGRQHHTGQAQESNHGHLPIHVGNERLRHGRSNAQA